MQKNVAHAAMFAAALVGAVCLVKFAFTVSHPAAEDLHDPTVNDEPVVIYAAADLINSLKVFDVESIANNAELRRLLDRIGSRNRWIVTLTRFDHTSGKFTTMPQMIELGKHDHLCRPSTTSVVRRHRSVALRTIHS
jgi:hypothetical protein